MTGVSCLMMTIGMGRVSGDVARVAGMLEIRGVSKRFGAVQALDDVTFAVRPGEVFGFVGSNGAGKTSTMRIVLGVLSADRGDVAWKGSEVDTDVRRRIGYMPEERGLYPKMKVGEQLTYLARLHGLGSAEAAVAVEHWTDLLDIGHRLGDEVQKLSLGNQQRVQLAAALTHDPEVLVLDEPFSGLDPTAVEVMSEVLRSKADAGVPVIFSSHQLELVERVCDRVGIVAAGAMVACGTVGELRRPDLLRDERRTFWLDAPGHSADGPGVRTLRREGSAALLSVDDHVDVRALLGRAVAAGPVHEFRAHRPPLSELYRTVVEAS